MRRTVAAILGTLLLGLAAPAGAQELSVITTDTKQTTVVYRQSHALVIGIDGYSGGWPKLGQARADAEAIAAELRRHGFAVTLRTDASGVLDKRSIEQLIDEFVYGPGTHQDARLLIWFAGHGHTIDGEGYLVPQDAPHPMQGPIEERPLVEARFRRSALSLRRFGEYMRETKAKHVLAVFDSCFGGTIFDATRAATGYDVTAATVTGKVRQFVSSGDAEQEVSDDGQFRKLFIDALDGSAPEADENKDGLITATELGRYLTYRVTSYKGTAQTPRYGRLRERGLDRGEFVFRVRKAQVAAAPTEPSAAQRAPAPSAPQVPEPPFTRRGSAASVYFITDRRRDNNPRVVGFTEVRNDKLTLGRAIVRAGAGSGGTTPAAPISDGLAILEPEEFLANLPVETARSEKYKGHALVYLHGYNISFDGAFQQAAQLALDIGFDAPVFAYSWPSAGRLTSYVQDIEAAAASGRLFVRFIDWLLRRSEVETVNVIAHSSGSAILLDALSRWSTADEFVKGKLGHFVFLAPDVGRDRFADVMGNRGTAGRSVTIYVSANDRALQVGALVRGSKSVGDARGGVFVTRGATTIDISALAAGAFAANHTTGLESRQVLADIALILQGRTEPDGRLPVFDRVVAPDGRHYWRWK